MPAFAYWPGTIPAGSRSTEIVSSLDIVPTAISLAGGSLPTDLIIDGRDASPLILTETGKSAHAFLPFYNEPVYGNASKEIFAARFGRYKAVRIPLDTPYCWFHCQGSCHNFHHPFGLQSPNAVCCSRCPAPPLTLTRAHNPGRHFQHFITSPGLGNGRWSWHGPSPKAYHDPPIVFDIDICSLFSTKPLNSSLEIKI